MINDKLIKALVLVTVMQSLLLVGIEIASYCREHRYIKQIEIAYERDQLFTFKEEDFEELDYNPLDFSNVPHCNIDHSQIEELNSKNVLTIAGRVSRNGNIRTA